MPRNLTRQTPSFPPTPDYNSPPNPSGDNCWCVYGRRFIRKTGKNVMTFHKYHTSTAFNIFKRILQLKIHFHHFFSIFMTQFGPGHFFSIFMTQFGPRPFFLNFYDSIRFLAIFSQFPFLKIYNFYVKFAPFSQINTFCCAILKFLAFSCCQSVLFEMPSWEKRNARKSGPVGRGYFATLHDNSNTPGCDVQQHHHVASDRDLQCSMVLRYATINIKRTS